MSKYTPIIPQDGIYKVESSPQLYWLAKEFNDGNLSRIKVELTKDIEVNDPDNPDRFWTPIGFSLYRASNETPFNGHFDGKGHKISGLYFNYLQSNYFSNNEYLMAYTGLFGIIGESGIVENLEIVSSEITGQMFLGLICGENRGTIKNCIVRGLVQGLTVSHISIIHGYSVSKDSLTFILSQNVGGIAGFNNGTIENCENYAKINGYCHVGGIAGKNSNKIINCKNKGQIKSDSEDRTLLSTITSAPRGCVQWKEDPDYSCDFQFQRNGMAGANAGGICGSNTDSSEITNCENDAEVFSDFSGG